MLLIQLARNIQIEDGDFTMEGKKSRPLKCVIVTETASVYTALVRDKIWLRKQRIVGTYVYF